MPKKKIDKVGGAATGSTTGSEYYILIMSILICVLVMLFLIPELARTPCEFVSISDLSTDMYCLVPNRIVDRDTEIKKRDSETGEIRSRRSKDLGPDELILTTVLSVQDKNHKVYSVMDNVVPYSAEISNAPQITYANCINQCEKLNYGIAVL